MRDIVAQNFKSILFTVASLMGLGVYALKPNPPATHPETQAQVIQPTPTVVSALPMAQTPQLMPSLMPVPAMPVSAPAAQESLTFVVASIGQSQQTGAQFLNSMPNYQMQGNNTIILEPSVGLQAQALLGKTVTATGRARTNKVGGKSITVYQAANLRIQ
jgi:hypothetical protein